MKVEQGKSDFKSVTITLETQDEVNQLYALVNYNPIAVCSPIALELYQSLKSVHDIGYNKYFSKIIAYLK